MRVFAIVALMASFTVQAAPASQDSVEALLSVTKTEAVMDSLYSGMDQMMRQTVNQTVEGKSLSAEQQHAIDTLPEKFVAIMRKEMSWQQMKPLYVRLYRETFEQEEIDGMLAFYNSPTGTALINKTPLLMQKSLTLSQELLQSAVPRMNTAIEEAMAGARAVTADILLPYNRMLTNKRSSNKNRFDKIDSSLIGMSFDEFVSHIDHDRTEEDDGWLILFKGENAIVALSDKRYLQDRVVRMIKIYSPSLPISHNIRVGTPIHAIKSKFPNIRLEFDQLEGTGEYFGPEELEKYSGGLPDIVTEFNVSSEDGRPLNKRQSYPTKDFRLAGKVSSILIYKWR